MRDSYIPLFESSLTSSLWSMSGDSIKFFLTLALRADPEGHVRASLGGLARVSGIPEPLAREIVAKLEAPDLDSKDTTRDPSATGARIERMPDGWRVINIEWYREEARKQSRLYSKRKWWREKGTSARRDARPTETETETETETDTDTETETETKPERRAQDPDPERASAPPALPPGVFNAISEQIRRLSTKVPSDFRPLERHLVRMQELKLDPDDTHYRFMNHEFQRAYSDWPRRFSIWIEDQKKIAETEAYKRSKR